jgi:hypothetical protein
MHSSTLGLSILAGGLAFVGSANAVDLIVNGSFEEPPTVGWAGSFRTYNFSAAYYRGPAIPESENPGSVYSWRHGITDTDFSGPCTQTVDLTTALFPEDIDAGRGTFMFSAWLASYGNPNSNPERPYVTVEFFDGSGTTQVGATAVLDRASGLNFVQFANGVTVFDSTTHEHHWAKYVSNGAIPAGARTARVGITRNPAAGLSGNPDTYTDLVKLDVDTAPFVPPSVLSTQPNGPNIRPDAAVSVVLQDGTTQVSTSSIQFTFDGVPVSPVIEKTGPTTTITYDPPGLLPPLSSHNVRVVFSDNAAQPTRLTNEFSFSVLGYYNLLLPSPIHLETFETTDEGSFPTGWSQLSYSAVPDPTCDLQSTGVSGLQDLNSACYANWVVVDSARFQSPMLTYGAHTPETDYRRVLSTNTANVVNNTVVDSLAQGKIVFGNSGYRDGASQIVYLFSPDFDLTGRTNVYLSFHSLWEQNQDSIGAVEYSIDEGATWLPLVYMIENADIVRDANGNIDAAATFTTPRTDIATYVDLPSGETRGGYSGAFIGVASNNWSTLGPYISGRVDDNPIESKRVEVFHLPAAANQSKVRLRFAHAGANSWYFGIDNVGLYSLSTASPPLLSGPSPTNVVDAVGNTIAFTVTPTGVAPFTYQWQHNGIIVPGQTNATLTLTNLQLTAAGSYRAIVGYLGGSVTSSPATLVVFTPEPARVIGQWDFNTAGLSATCGPDLEYSDQHTEIETGFATTDVLGLPGIEGQAVSVMSFPGAQIEPMDGYIMRHGLGGTGGGTNVNQYTLIMDVLYPEVSDNLRRALLQTDPLNTDDDDFRINEADALGVSGSFHGTIEPNTWYRIALAVDLVGPGPHPVVAKFINGVKVAQQILTEGRDGRWSLSANPETPWARLFADNDTHTQPGYVSSVQLRQGRLSDAAIAAMGGPQPTKIPGAACAMRSGASLTIKWSGSALESADNITGPWAPVPAAANPYTVPTPLGGRKFYRAR